MASTLGSVRLTNTIFYSVSSAWVRIKVSMERDFDLTENELF